MCHGGATDSLLLNEHCMGQKYNIHILWFITLKDLKKILSIGHANLVKSPVGSSFFGLGGPASRRPFFDSCDYFLISVFKALHVLAARQGASHKYF